jgi:hypothetical protein
VFINRSISAEERDEHCKSQALGMHLGEWRRGRGLVRLHRRPRGLIDLLCLESKILDLWVIFESQFHILFTDA